jgi:hypothetical protein
MKRCLWGRRGMLAAAARKRRLGVTPPSYCSSCTAVATTTTATRTGYHRNTHTTATATTIGAEEAALLRSSTTTMTTKTKTMTTSSTNKSTNRMLRHWLDQRYENDQYTNHHAVVHQRYAWWRHAELLLEHTDCLVTVWELLELRVVEQQQYQQQQQQQHQHEPTADDITTTTPGRRPPPWWLSHRIPFSPHLQNLIEIELWQPRDQRTTSHDDDGSSCSSSHHRVEQAKQIGALIIKYWQCGVLAAPSGSSGGGRDSSTTNFWHETLFRAILAMDDETDDADPTNTKTMRIMAAKELLLHCVRNGLHPGTRTVRNVLDRNGTGRMVIAIGPTTTTTTATPTTRSTARPRSRKKSFFTWTAATTHY